MSDDLDDDELEMEGESFDDFEKKNQTLGELWQNNPAVKVGVVVVAAIVIFGTIMLFGGESEDVDLSLVPAGSQVSAPPGTEEASPAYIAAIEEDTEARIEEARQTGGSALPTPIDPPVGRLSVPEEETEAEDPLQRWRQLQEARLQRELQQTQTIDPGPVPDDTARTEAVQALAESMSQQMQSILQSLNENTGVVQSMDVTDARFLTQGQGGAAGAGASGSNGGGADNFFEDEALENFQNVLLPAGEIVYAQLLTEANSDVEGPILAEIMSGPLMGSRIIGSFSKTEADLLILNFDTIIVDGISIGINAVAVDPQTTLTAMATDVDHRYFKRVVLPMAAAFVEGLASAISESGTTTVTIQGETVAEESEETDSGQEVASGIEEAGQELREILDDMADVETLVRVEAGTPMGILFLEEVAEGNEETVEAP